MKKLNLIFRWNKAFQCHFGVVKNVLKTQLSAEMFNMTEWEKAVTVLNCLQFSKNIFEAHYSSSKHQNTARQFVTINR